MQMTERFKWKMKAVTGAQPFLPGGTGAWCFVELPFRGSSLYNSLHMSKPSMFFFECALGRLCMCEHTCASMRLSVNPCACLSSCQRGSPCSSLWPAPCPITASIRLVSSKLRIQFPVACHFYFCPRSTFVLHSPLIVSRSHWVFSFFLPLSVTLSPSFHHLHWYCMITYQVVDGQIWI